MNYPPPHSAFYRNLDENILIFIVGLSNIFFIKITTEMGIAAVELAATEAYQQHLVLKLVYN